jgi:predicted nucleotidyltransferase
MVEKKPKSLTEGLNSNVKYNGPIPGTLGTVGNGVSMPNGFPKQKTPEEIQEEFEALKKKLDGLKKNILDKYKFTRFLSILPGASLPEVAEDENMPIDLEKSNPKLLFMCIPEEQYKNIPKIKPEIMKMIKETKENIWLMIKTEVDLWNYGLDSKFNLLDSVSASFPLHDNGFLGNLRLANIHKSLVLRKFEKYVATYAIGGSLVRGTATKTSDVDTFVIIDDTDVKRIPRLELLEKLRGIIYDYIKEANALSGVKNVLNVQVYLLTDFWMSVKDAHPVMFTFIRDGVPMYDRGTFIPWKLLLKMGKIKPSPEAVDNFMKSGDQNENLVKRRLMDAMIDIYWGIVTPTQALMMLSGNAPPEPKIIVQEVKKVLVEKEKVMTIKDLKFLEKIVGMYKDYEHGKLKEVSGKEVDELKSGSDSFVKSMKEVRKKLEARMQVHVIENNYDETFDLLKKIFGNKSREKLIVDVEKELVLKGKLQKKMLAVLKDLIKAKTQDKKLSPSEMQKLIGEVSELNRELLDYSQRKELAVLEKGTLLIKNGKVNAEVITSDSGVFVITGGVVQKISGKKLEKSSREELEKALKETKDRLKPKIDSKVFEVLKKEFGEFEVFL